MGQDSVAGERGADLHEVSGNVGQGDTPQSSNTETRPGLYREDGCERRAHTRGWCASHYRRHRSGAAMDDPIRQYKRQRPRPLRREYPFKKELELLRELGLR